MSYEPFHLASAVKHCVIHVDVDYRGTVLDLSCSNLKGCLIFSGSNQTCKLSGSGYICPLTYIGEIVLCDIDCNRLQAADLECAFSLQPSVWHHPLNSVSNGSDMFRTGSAASSHYVYKAL